MSGSVHHVDLIYMVKYNKYRHVNVFTWRLIRSPHVNSNRIMYMVYSSVYMVERLSERLVYIGV